MCSVVRAPHRPGATSSGAAQRDERRRRRRQSGPSSSSSCHRLVTTETRGGGSPRAARARRVVGGRGGRRARGEDPGGCSGVNGRGWRRATLRRAPRGRHRAPPVTHLDDHAHLGAAFLVVRRAPHGLVDEPADRLGVGDSRRRAREPRRRSGATQVKDMVRPTNASR